MSFSANDHVLILTFPDTGAVVAPNGGKSYSVQRDADGSNSVQPEDLLAAMPCKRRIPKTGYYLIADAKIVDGQRFLKTTAYTNTGSKIRTE